MSFGVIIPIFLWKGRLFYKIYEVFKKNLKNNILENI